MAAVDAYTFSLKEAAEALIKQQGLHEGIWQVGFELGLGGGNLSSAKGLRPTAMITILNLRLKRAEKESELSIDAAKVNPTST